MKEYSSRMKFTSNDIHLKSIFSGDYYLELGNIDIDVMKRLLKYDVINVNEITYYPIQNKGLGTNVKLSGEIKNKLPFMFFKSLNEKDRSKQLFLTYGLLDFYNANLKDRFIPIFLLPIELYYEEGEFYIQLISKPFENPLMLNVLGDTYRGNLKQRKNFSSLYNLDYTLSLINRIPGCEVKLENYITFGTIKKRDIIKVEKLFSRVKLENDFYVTKVYGHDDNYYMSNPYTKSQRKFLALAMQGDNLTLSGHDGTGKTTVLKDICVNKIYNGDRVLYITNKQDTINNVKAYFENIGLAHIVTDLTGAFNHLFDSELSDKDYQEYEYSDKLAILQEKYRLAEEYEEIMGGRIADFRFSEILEELGILVDLERSDDKIINEDDINNLDYIYKFEFNRIKTSLENIQSNLYKLNSFKECVWKEIPIINSIKYANQIIQLISQINNGYEKLIKYKYRLENEFGIREIANYAEFRKIVNIIDGLDVNLIPELWRESYDNYKKASESYNQLKSDIYNHQESKYYLNTRYNNLENLNIKNNIKLIQGKFFKYDDNEKINDIIKNVYSLKEVCDKGVQAKKIYDAQSHNLRAVLHWNFTDDDAQIKSLIDLIDLVLNNDISLRLCMSVIDDKYLETKENIESLRDKISKAYVKLKKMIAEYPNLDEERVKNNLELLEKQPNKIRSIRKKYNNLTLEELEDLFKQYNELLRRIKVLKEKYYVASGFKYDSKFNHIVILDAINNYVKSIKDKPYKKVIERFLESIDSRKRNEKFNKLRDDFRKFYESYLYINELFIILNEKHILQYENDSFLSKLSNFDNAISYIDDVYNTNQKMLIHFKHNDEMIIKYESYLNLNSVLDEYNAFLEYLKTNKVYHSIYGYLYEAEATNVTTIAKDLQTYSEFNNVFKSSDDLIFGFKNIDSLKELIANCNDELASLNEVLKIYARIFSDGVSRYYYNSFSSIISYLKSLSDAKEDLICYLSITNGLSILNEYDLKSLIEYIVSTDKCDNLVNNFEYLYFNRLKDKYLDSVSEKYQIITEEEYLNVLKEIYDLEEEIRFANNNIIIEEICDKTSHKVINHIVKNRSFNRYIRVNNGKMLVLANTTIVENWLNVQNFDVLIIDDAELISGISFLSQLRNMQIIIAGSYLVHKAVTNNLLSAYFDDKTIIFKERFFETPKKLLDKASRIIGLVKGNVNENNGVEVINTDIEEYILSLYMENANIKINYFVKDVDKKRKLIEMIAYIFSKNNIDDKIILDFLNKNINITDLMKFDVINADYNILDLSDYLYLDSDAEATNACGRLLFPKEKLIIYDKGKDLNSESELPFFSYIKSLEFYKSNDDLFDYNVMDRCIGIIIKSLRSKKVDVYPSCGNADLLLVDKNKFNCSVILFSNYSYNEALNYFRHTKTQYERNGWNVLFMNKMAYVNGLEYFSEQISKKLDWSISKKKNKKGNK